MNQIKLSLFILIISFSVAREIEYKPIPLSGLITNRKQEISGMDLYNQHVVLLPENLGGFLYMIPKDDIINSLDTENPSQLNPNNPHFTHLIILKLFQDLKDLKLSHLMETIFMLR